MLISMSTSPSPAVFIRTHVFGVKTQEEFGYELGYTQAQISRFENGLPFSRNAQERIRDLARKRKIAWDNNWFFEVPKSVA